MKIPLTSPRITGYVHHSALPGMSHPRKVPRLTLPPMALPDNWGEYVPLPQTEKEREKLELARRYIMKYRYFICKGIYRCVYDGGIRACLLGLKISKTPPSQITFVIHRHEAELYHVTKDDVKLQVLRAIYEKEREYNHHIYVDTIEYFENDPLPYKDAYYEFSKKILDRIYTSNEYIGSEDL